jgi:hypothetical protein
MKAPRVRCVVCGRLKPKGAQWNTFVGAMRGKTPVICGVVCLRIWTRRDQPASSGPAGDVMTVRWRVADAARAGAICGRCGRQFDPSETVWRVPVAIGRRLNGSVGHLPAPVGRECVDADVLWGTEGQPPECCEGCGRSIYYWRGSRLRRRALCSDRCRQVVQSRCRARTRQQAKKLAR